MSSPLTGFPWRCGAGWLEIDDPEFGYRLLAEGVAAAGFTVAVRTVWRKVKVAAPAHGDLVQRRFTADGSNKVWLTDITGHCTGVGKVCLCGIKDVWFNRIVGYRISDRMESSNALGSAVARRAGDVAGCVFHSDRGGRFRSRKRQQALFHHRIVGSMGQAGSAGVDAAMESFLSLLQRNVLDRQRWETREERRIAILTWIERTYHHRRRRRTDSPDRPQSSSKPS